MAAMVITEQYLTKYMGIMNAKRIMRLIIANEQSIIDGYKLATDGSINSVIQELDFNHRLDIIWPLMIEILHRYTWMYDFDAFHAFVATGKIWRTLLGQSPKCWTKFLTCAIHHSANKRIEYLLEYVLRLVNHFELMNTFLQMLNTTVVSPLPPPVSASSPPSLVNTPRVSYINILMMRFRCLMQQENRKLDEKLLKVSKPTPMMTEEDEEQQQEEEQENDDTAAL